MKLPAYLSRSRHGVYYFRAVIPPFLRPYFPNKEIKRSLHTDCRLAAIRLAKPLSIALLFITQKGRQEVKDPKIWDMIDSFLKGSATPSQPEPKLILHRTPGPLVAALDEKISGLAKLDLTPSIDTLLSKQLGIVQNSSPVYARAFRELLLAYGDIVKDDVLNDQALENNACIALSLSSSSSSSVKPHNQVYEIAVSEVIANYISEQNQWTPKTKDENRAILKLFVDLAKNIPILSIDHAVMREVKTFISRLPANLNKVAAYRDKSLEEILAMPDLPPMSVTTANKYLSRVSSFFNWADRLREAKLEQLRSDVRQGLASGPSETWDAEAVKSKAHTRRASKPTAA